MGPAHWLVPSLGDLCNGLKQNGKALFLIFDASSGQQPRNLYRSQQTRVCRQTIGAVNVKATAPHKSAVTHAWRLSCARSERRISPLKCRDRASWTSHGSSCFIYLPCLLPPPPLVLDIGVRCSGLCELKPSGSVAGLWNTTLCVCVCVYTAAHLYLGVSIIARLCV